MSDSTNLDQLSRHHRATLAHIRAHPTSDNLEWNDVVGLLGEVADVSEEHNGTFVAKIGTGKIVLTRPCNKDVDEQMLRDVGHLLASARLISLLR